MFKCEITGKFSKPGDKAIRLVTEYRERFYMSQNADGEEDFENGEVVGSGMEIQKEINVTLAGLGIWCDRNPQDVASRERYNDLVRAEEARRRAEIAKKASKPES